MEDKTIVDGDILGEDELVYLCEESLLLPGVKHVLQTGDQGPDGHLVTPILAQEEHQQGELRRVQQRPGLERILVGIHMIGEILEISQLYFFGHIALIWVHAGCIIRLKMGHRSCC